MAEWDNRVSLAEIKDRQGIKGESGYKNQVRSCRRTGLSSVLTARVPNKHHKCPSKPLLSTQKISNRTL